MQSLGSELLASQHHSTGPAALCADGLNIFGLWVNLLPLQSWSALRSDVFLGILQDGSGAGF